MKCDRKPALMILSMVTAGAVVASVVLAQTTGHRSTAKETEELDRIGVGSEKIPADPSRQKSAEQDQEAPSALPALTEAREQGVVVVRGGGRIADTAENDEIALVVAPADEPAAEPVAEISFGWASSRALNRDRASRSWSMHDDQSWSYHPHSLDYRRSDIGRFATENSDWDNHPRGYDYRSINSKEYQPRRSWAYLPPARAGYQPKSDWSYRQR